MGVGPTREEFDRAHESLLDQMRVGFTGINTRLDALNGRIGKSEVAQGQADIKLKNLEREVFHRRSEDAELEPSHVHRREPERPITGQDLTFAGIGASLLWVGFRLFVVGGQASVNFVRELLRLLVSSRGGHA